MLSTILAGVYKHQSNVVKRELENDQLREVPHSQVAQLFLAVHLCAESADHPVHKHK